MSVARKKLAAQITVCNITGKLVKEKSVIKNRTKKMIPATVHIS